MPPDLAGWSVRRPALLALVVMMVVALGGCAATQAFRDGQRLADGDDLRGALSKYSEALNAEPGNLAYKMALLTTQRRLVAVDLTRAREALAAGDAPRAGAHLRRVLETDATNAVALQGLEALAQDARHQTELDQAQRELGEGKVESARTRVADVLAQSPRLERANRMLREIDARAALRSKEKTLADAYRKPVALEFRDATLRQVIDVLASTSGLNFILDKDVKADQKFSILLKNSTVEAAVNYLLLSNQLASQVLDRNTVMVYPNTPQKAKEYQQLRIRTFVLSNGSAKSVAEMLRTVLKIRDVVVDEKTNMIIIQDSSEAIDLAERLVALQDFPEPEVMLEVEILEISRERVRELGIAWPSSLSLAPLSSDSGQPLTLSDLTNLSRRSIGVGVDPLKINAKATDSDTNILANPKIRVLNREKARVIVGNKVPSISSTTTSTGVTIESVNYFDVGLKLEVEPIIFVSNDITIKIGLEVSSIIGTDKSDKGTVTYTIGNRAASTVLRLKDGENQVLAGLINNEERRSANKVPGLGEIPLAGRLFGSTRDGGSRTEVVLSITPRLIRNTERPSAAAADFPSGSDAAQRGPVAPSASGPAVASPPAEPRGNEGRAPAPSETKAAEERR